MHHYDALKIPINGNKTSLSHLFMSIITLDFTHKIKPLDITTYISLRIITTLIISESPPDKIGVFLHLHDPQAYR